MSLRTALKSQPGIFKLYLNQLKKLLAHFNSTFIHIHVIGNFWGLETEAFLGLKLPKMQISLHNTLET